MQDLRFGCPEGEEHRYYIVTLVTSYKASPDNAHFAAFFVACGTRSPNQHSLVFHFCSYIQPQTTNHQRYHIGRPYVLYEGPASGYIAHNHSLARPSKYDNVQEKPVLYWHCREREPRWRITCRKGKTISGTPYHTGVVTSNKRFSYNQPPQQPDPINPSIQQNFPHIQADPSPPSHCYTVDFAQTHDTKLYTREEKKKAAKER